MKFFKKKSAPAAEIKLAPPGAGIPAWEEAVLRYIVLPIWYKSYHWERALAYFQEQGAIILEMYRKIDPAKATQRVLIPRTLALEDSSRNWSAAMVLEHLAIVDRAVIGILQSLAAGKAPDAVASTAAVKPKGEWSAIEADQKFFQTIIDYSRAAKLANMNKEPRYRHPWFGALPAHGWHVFTSLHHQIHRKQLEEIIKRL
ncbi:MAG: hypothetical protein AB7G80_03205 [Dongiaceae bacterium]